MDQALTKVREALAQSKAPAVLSSFGKDSMLLLWLIREAYTGTVPVIWFPSGHDESFGRRMVREWDLTVFRWWPADVYVLEEPGVRTMVHEYAVNGERLPVLIDLADVNYGPCAAGRFRLRTPNMFLPFDTLLVGWKDSDTHWVKGDAPLAEDGFELGGVEFIAPLRHMTDDAVRAAIVDHQIPFEPTPDELTLCTHCVSTKPLGAFRSRFNLTEEVDHGGRIRG